MTDHHQSAKDELLNRIKDEVAKSFNESFDYRSLRNGVQVGNIKMIHLDKVNNDICTIYAEAIKQDFKSSLKRRIEERIKDLETTDATVQITENKRFLELLDEVEPNT